MRHKRNGLAAQAWRVDDRWARIRRAIAKVTLRKSQNRLPAECIRLARRIEVRIAQPVIDRRQACRSGVTEVADLHWRRLAREREQPVSGEVLAEVDKNVDFVPANQLR